MKRGEAAAPNRHVRVHMRWFRCDNRIARHAKWRVVAAMTEVSIPEVVAIIVDLLGQASAARPRGYVTDYSVLEGGAALGIRPETITSVLAALESLGWIDQDMIVTWDEYQPERDGDPTAAERMRRYRQRKRGQRSVMSSVSVTASPVTVTPTVQNIDHLNGDSEAGTGAAHAAQPQRGLGDQGVNWKAEVETEGLAIIVRRRSITRIQAKGLLQRWLVGLSQDHEKLAVMLGEAERLDLLGPQFEQVITGWINEKKPLRQAALPLGPAVMRGGRA